MESKEANAHGKKDVPRLKVVVQQLGNHSCKEIGVLEVGQKTQIDRQTQGNEPLAKPSSRAMTIDRGSDEIVAQGDKSQQEEVKPAAFIIEILGKSGDEE